MGPIIKFVAFILLIGLLFHISCQKELSCENCSFNKPPIANAGKDTAIILPVDSIALDGGASTDPDDTITSYKWIKISGPDSSGISNPDSSKTLINALVMGVYKFELTVTDDSGLSAKDTIQVTVDDSLPLCSDLVSFGSLSFARYGVSAIAAGSKILFAGGSYATTPPPYSLWVTSTRVDIYDTLTKKWSTAELSEPRYLPIIVTVGDKVFFADGVIDDVSRGMDIYDITSNTWSKVALPYPDMLIVGSAGTAVGDKIYFAGVSSDKYTERHTDSVYIYDIPTRSWSPSSVLLSEKRSTISATSVGNKIYFAGGEGYDSTSGIYVTNKVDIYDAASNAWSATTMYEPKLWMTSIVAGNKIFWAGGLNAFNFPSWYESDLVEVYDVNTGTSTHHQLSVPSYRSTAVVKENKIIFFGGWASPNIADVFDMNSQTWTSHNFCIGPEITNTGITVAGNNIYVAGGFVNGVISNKVWKLEF